MKIIILVPDGVAVRNYLYSSFISELESHGVEVFIFHKLSNSALDEVKKVQKKIKGYYEMPSFIETPKTRVLRESLAYGRLLINKKKLKNNTIMSFWNKKPKGMKQKVLYSIAETLGFLISKSPKLLLKLDKAFEKAISQNRLGKEIEEHIIKIEPSLILNLHQRSPITAPIITRAKALNIKTSTVIFSWDNVPKARLISRYDEYLVWSKLMKDELELLYPEINGSQIKIVGTPQFEFYFNPSYFEPKKTFFETFGLSESKKTICFSANDLSSPYEANYLEDVCEVVSKIEEERRPQILFRKCPVDKSDRFDYLIKKYENIIFEIEPDWTTDKSNDTNFTSIYPKYNDLRLLVNTVRHSDLVINLGSTMAHDFAVLNKPCLYLNYDPVINSVFDVKTVYEFQHFRSMEGLDAVGWIKSKDEIRDKIEQFLLEPNRIGKDRKAWMERVVLHPLENNSKHIAKAII